MATQRFNLWKSTWYETPEIPPLKKIRGSHLKLQDQVWTRHTEYKQWNWNDDPKKGAMWWDKPSPGQLEWYYDEIDRILHGEWVMIEGRPVYLNLFAYFYFQWFVTKEGFYPKFKDTCISFMYFMEHVFFKNHKCRGGNTMKGRRKHVSTMCMSIMLQFGLIKQNIEEGITSMAAKDAEKIFQLMLVNGYSRLPNFLKPRISGTDDPKTTLHITKQAGKITKDQATGASKDGLNNRIEWRAPKSNVFDGDGLWFLLLDECLHPDTKILCEGYIFRPIKDIKIGDLVYVEGGKLLPVMQKFEGYDEMYRIHQPYSKDYIVSSRHRLYLEQRCKVDSIKDDGIKYYTPEQFIKLGKYRKRTTHGLRSLGLVFPEKEMLIDPYIFGAWIGDGRYTGLSFICNFVDEPELLSHLVNYGQQKGYITTVNPISYCKKAVWVIYNLNKKHGSVNYLTTELKRLGVYKNKRIPTDYLHNSRENRLKLLAGLIDTDGHASKGKRHGSITFAMSKMGIIEDISFLAKSLGFSVSNIKYAKSNFGSDTWKLSISGDLSTIPTIVKRKNFNKYEKQYAFRRNRIEISKLGIGQYIGIQVKADCDEDRRLILEDFTITMNCGKWPTDVPIDEYLEIASNIITAGEEMGRIVCITTVNKGDKGGTRYKIVWDGSDQDDLDELGQTKNKLIQYFIPGYMGGRDLGWVDKFGNSVWDTPTEAQTEWLKNDPYTLDPYMGCKAYCELQRRLKADDPEKLQEEIRMFPFTPEEVFRGANNSCYFNIKDLNDQVERVEAKLEYASLYRKGLFRASSNGDAYFEDAELGTPNESPEFMWYFLDLPEQKDANKYTWIGGHRTPTNTDWGVAGADLINNSETTAEKGSDASICIFKRYNALDPDNSGMIAGLGIGRPSSVAFMHEQLFLCLRYCGIKALIERSPITWYDYALDKKLLGYCVKTNLKITGEERYGIAAQDGEGREQHLTEMIEYASANVGKIWYLRVLRDMFGFNVKERTLYDACMSFGYALMGLKDKHRQMVHDEDTVQMYRIYDLRAKYGKRTA